MKREKIIAWLVYDDMRYIRTDAGMEWLENLLRAGFAGYEGQNTEQLRHEMKERLTMLGENTK